MKSKYIVSPWFDWLCFLGSPALCLVFGIAVSHSWFVDHDYTLNGQRDSLGGFFMQMMIQAHLVAVVFRSHGNASIRAQYPFRFYVVPVVLYAAIVASPWVAVASTVVATFWDVWHSGAQTFGFARIYERNHGTPPELGRRLDFWLNQILYAGPILAGATLMDHVGDFDDFNKVGDAFFGSVPAHVAGIRGDLSIVVIAVIVAFLVFYVASYWRLAKRGWRPSWLKVWLLASTGFVSVYSWGFNSWGQAFLIMNLFHAVQYLALVWAMEGKRISALFRLPDHRRLALGIYLALVLGYGFACLTFDASLLYLWAATIVISLMHFWYDAFVWSVRKAQV